MGLPLLSFCQCCELVETSFTYKGRPRCDMCRQFCHPLYCCNVKDWLGVSNSSVNPVAKQGDQSRDDAGT